MEDKLLILIDKIISQRLNGKVYYRDSIRFKNRPCYGLITDLRDGSSMIEVKKSLSTVEKILVLFHEYAHYMLHHGPNSHRRLNYFQMEAEANYFALHAVKALGLSVPAHWKERLTDEKKQYKMFQYDFSNRTHIKAILSQCT